MASHVGPARAAWPLPCFGAAGRGPRRSARRSTRLGAARALAAAAVAVLAAGCAEEPRERRGGTAVIVAATDLDYANPLVSAERWTNEVLRFALFTPLIRYGPDLEYQPHLAESWELLGDTGVVFRLRRDVRWHDGRPTTAEDVLFTYERAADPATGFPNADYFRRWTGGEVVDSYTVRFTWEPHAEPLAGLPFTPVAPRHVLDTVPAAAMRQAPFNRSPVGNGPFRFLSMRANDRWVLERNPDFPEALGGPPLVERLVWRVVPDAAAQLAELRAGEAHLALQGPPGRIQELARAEGLRVIRSPSRQFSFVAWNARREPLGDPRVRRALAMAIDREAILTALRKGLGEVAVGPIPPFHWSFDAGLEPLPHAPDSARALLATAGIRDRDGDGRLELPDGSPLRVQLKLAAGNDFNRDLAEAIRADLAELGVEATTRSVEMNTLIGDITSPDRNFDAVLLAWAGDFRLDLRDLFHSDAAGGPYQFASYANPRVDSLMDRASAEPDRSRATPLWRRVQRILRDEQPWTAIYYQTDAFLARDQLRGVEADIRGLLLSLPDWWLEPASGEETDGA